jgi:hypothetical protein
MKFLLAVTILSVVLIGNAMSEPNILTIRVTLESLKNDGFIGVVDEPAGPFNSGDIVVGSAWAAGDGVKHLCIKRVIPYGATNGPSLPNGCFAT